MQHHFIIISAMVAVCISSAEAQPRMGERTDVVTTVSGKGLQLGRISGITGLPQSDYDYALRVFVRHDFSHIISGEAGAGLGFIGGISYRTRLFPVEYRLLYRPYRGRKIWLPGRLGIEPYFYAGLGGMLYRPVQVRADDDPLTAETGPALPYSSYWHFRKGFTGVIPLGAGVEIGLDGGNTLILSAGYNQTITDNLAGIKSGALNGFWGFSAGIKLKTIQRNEPEPAKFFSGPRHPARPLPVAVAEINHDKDYSFNIIEEINRRSIYFQVLRSEVRPYFHRELDNIGRLLSGNQNIHLRIHGHADAHGDSLMNNSLSIERAWNAAAYLMESGVDLSRMEILAMGHRKPAASNDTDEGRRVNRRVDFEAYYVDPIEEAYRLRPMLITEYLADVNDESGPVLISGNMLKFRWLTTELWENSINNVIRLAGTLQNHPHWEVLIVSYPGAGKSEDLRRFLSAARPEAIKRELIYYGIEHSRIRTAMNDEVPEEYADLIPETDGSLGIVVLRLH